MLAAIAPAAIRRVYGLRRVAPLPGLGEWGAGSRREGVEQAPLLVLWDSLVPQSRPRAAPLWSRFLSSSASGSGRDGEGASGGSDGSGKDGKDAESGILEAVREGGASKEEPVEKEALGETGKAEASGKWSRAHFGIFHFWNTRSVHSASILLDRLERDRRVLLWEERYIVQ